MTYPGFSKTNTYTYYKNGLKESFTGLDNIAVGYLYDSNNQLTGMQIPDVGMFTVNRYQWNRPAEETLPGGAKRHYQYDSLMRVENINTQDPGGNDQLDYGHGYDKADNITGKSTGNGDYAYEYDALHRLTRTETTEPALEAFAYDAVGNRVESIDTSGSWHYNANNELEGYADVTFDYDANGNMIEKSVGGVVTRFFYNLEDRLERVEDGGGAVIAAYYYDPFGRRLWKDVGGVRTCFHYADEGLVGEYDGGGVEIKTYGWKSGGSWSTDPVFLKIGAQYYWYHNDHLGTPQKLTTSSGAIVWSAKYSSFGKATVDAGSTVVNPLRFPGQYEDAETGLFYNYHRYYDTLASRYLRTDPIDDPSSFIISKTFRNPYSYSSLNPLSRYDNYGLKDKTGPIRKAWRWYACGDKIDEMREACGENWDDVYLTIRKTYYNCKETGRKCFQEGKTQEPTCPEDDPCTPYCGTTGSELGMGNRCLEIIKWEKVIDNNNIEVNEKCKRKLGEAGQKCLRALLL